MRILHKLCVFCLSTVLAGLAISTINLPEAHEMNKANALKDGILDEVLYEHLGKIGQQFKKKYGLISAGGGGGATSEGIWLMCVSFDRFAQELNEKEARRLIISCMHDFLDSVNNDKKLSPFLKDYPFTSNNVELKIFNYNPDHTLPLFPSISVVKNVRGKIGYFTEDPSTQPKYHTKKYETYEEAIAILKQETQ